MKIRAQYKPLVDLAKTMIPEIGSHAKKEDLKLGLAMLESACNKGDINSVASYAKDERELVRVTAQTIFDRHIRNTRKAA